MKPIIKVRLDDRRLVAIPALLNHEADDLCGKTAKAIESRMKLKILTEPKTGRIYRKGNVLHQASAPGEAPATDTGNLANSIESERVKPLVHHVNVYAEYGVYLEYGTTRMLPRPFLKPSFEEQREEFARGVSQLIAKARNRFV